jgi:hypothetical protein
MPPGIAASAKRPNVKRVGHLRVCTTPARCIDVVCTLGGYPSMTGQQEEALC